MIGAGKKGTSVRAHAQNPLDWAGGDKNGLGHFYPLGDNDGWGEVK